MFSRKGFWGYLKGEAGFQSIALHLQLLDYQSDLTNMCSYVR